jgi:hypothetical protein
MRHVFKLILALMLMAGMARANPDYWQQEWPETDFSNTSVANWDEVMSGGPPKDGILALQNPKFHKAGAENKIKDNEPVITVEIAGATPRAYPIRYLTWHEIVNDKVGGVPVAVTFCPLCNSGIVFDRRTKRGTLTFGVTGKLRNSDMVMYDHETESWWQQAIGEAIVGDLNGTKLKSIPGWMESWGQFKARNPRGLVMKQPPHSRRYGFNPYRGYDSLNQPFLYRGELPPHGIPALARVVRVGDRAWLLTRIRDEGGVNEAGVRLSWEGGQASALDAGVISEGRDVGTVRVRDAKGRDMVHDVMFAFAFHAFWPDGKWMLAK